MKLRIRYFPDQALKVKTKKIIKFDYKLKNIAEEMRLLMKEHLGMGIASVQCGLDISIAICMDEVNNICYTLCNPVIVHSEGEVELTEGCISAPNIFLKLIRAEKVTCVYQDLNGKQQTLKADGWLGRCLIHEIEHLSGLSFLEYKNERKD